MKTVRLLSIVFVFVLAFSVCTPAFALPKSLVSDSSPEVKVMYTNVKVINHTGGYLSVVLVGVTNGRYYSLTVGNNERGEVRVESGRYTYTVTTLACGGRVSKTRSITGASTSLGQFVCWW